MRNDGTDIIIEVVHNAMHYRLCYCKITAGGMQQKVKPLIPIKRMNGVHESVHIVIVNGKKVLGMLVLQDLVPGGRRIRMRLAGWLPLRLPASRHLVGDRNPIVRRLLGAGSKAEGDEWLHEAMEQVRTLRPHPCVIAWTVFNEGWGQHSARKITRLLRRADPTRPVDATSGWFDQRAGDFLSVHDYDEGLRVLDAELEGGLRGFGRRCRAVLLSEFGGPSYAVPGHRPSGAAWGYVRYEGRVEFAEAFRGLMGEAERRLARSLAGYVYTQLYDVEQECNGILTYDREVDKLEGL